MNAGEPFLRMDWGPQRNMETYGTLTPPVYNLSAVTAPVILFWADNDWLATPTVDVVHFYWN